MENTNKIKNIIKTILKKKSVAEIDVLKNDLKKVIKEIDFELQTRYNKMRFKEIQNPTEYQEFLFLLDLQLARDPSF